MPDFSADLLAWYDTAARDLPWRIQPADRAAGIWPDPYRVWLSEVMLQQTTVATVKGHYAHFLAKWPTIADLAAASVEEVLEAWAGLGYYARARNMHRCARHVANELGGCFPRTEEGLLELPGVGPYTGAAIAAIAFDIPATVVDGNVERVMSRIRKIDTPLPGSRPLIRQAASEETPASRPGDYAQAMMDLGATICSPRAPKCDLCPVQAHCCAFDQGVAEALPIKKPKATKPTRTGHVWIGRRTDDSWLVERRPDTGLLGGTLGWPGSDWSAVPDWKDPPVVGRWISAGTVRHTFTHFHLELEVRTALLAENDTAPKSLFFEPNLLNDALPTVMKKAMIRAQSVLE